VRLWLRKSFSRFAHSLKDVKTFGTLDDGSTPPIPTPHIFWPQHLLHIQNRLHSVLAQAFSHTHTHNEHWLAEGRSPKLVLGKLENFKCCQEVRVNRGLVKTFLGRGVQ